MLHKVGELSMSRHPLLCVKSILTIIMAVVFCILALEDKVTPEQFNTSFTVIISFYFGTQYQKGLSKNEI